MSGWIQAFATGYPEIDAEHREVLQRLDALAGLIEAGGDGREIQALMQTLQRYVLGHFSREEACMLRVRCPAYQANSGAHAEFTEKFAGWVAQLERTGAPVALARQIHGEARTWIEAHILNVDCALRRTPRPAPAPRSR
jgi:hemerythrin